MNIRVRNYHLDGYGHVNNARYLEFLEEARWAFFEEHGFLSEIDGLMLVVVRTDIRYRRAAVDGDILRFEGRLKELVPGFGIKLNDNPQLAEEIISHNAKVLGIHHQ